MFFDDWFSMFRILTIGVGAYFALIVVLRVSGKRTLAKWNAFDFVVTIALGSILATVVISKDVSLAEGVAALLLLIGLQFIITWLSVRCNLIKDLVKSEPTLLLSKGKFIPDSLKSQRVSEAEVRAAIRSAGVAAIEDVEAVVLETDGSLSVVKASAGRPGTALEDVKGREQ
jgi:uncharacterized membrane protein YcaP (DUF421 family)